MIGIMFRGMAMGITEVVPGVSGSTVAMILGIYDRLVYSLSILTTNKRKEAIPFLSIFGLGMAIGFVSALFVIDFLLTNYRTPTLMFFVGIIIGFLPYLWKEALYQSKGYFELKHYSIIGISFCVVIIGQFIGDINNFDVNNLSIIDYMFLVSAGFIASIALVLPGISGALILTILGIYEIASDSLMTLRFPIIFAIFLGIFLGVLLTSRLIRYFLKNHFLETYSVMIGLVGGSIFAILNNLNGVVNSQIIIISTISLIAGITLVLILKQNQSNSIG
ncbi:DUF368 domain-containing protein [Halalkalibacillus sediminis]|nr:DUF368 domain-containing protein [Halalkalibacillus sediminis]